MASLSISRAWDETKGRLAADGRLFTIVAAALILLPQAVVAVVAPPANLSGEEPAGWVNLLALAAFFIAIIGQIALIRLAQRTATSVGEAISHGLKRFLPVVAAFILVGIGISLIAIPLMLLVGGLGPLEPAQGGAMPRSVAIAASIILMLVLLFGPKILLMLPVATAEPGGPIRILKRSWSIAGGHYFQLLGFLLLIFVAAFVVVIVTQLVGGSILALVFGDIRPMTVGALLYGLLFGIFQAGLAVVISLMLARIYLQLSGRDSLDVTVPRTGT